RVAPTARARAGRASCPGERARSGGSRATARSSPPWPAAPMRPLQKRRRRQVEGISSTSVERDGEQEDSHREVLGFSPPLLRRGGAKRRGGLPVLVQKRR